ncbi:hypothetical protein L6164_022906 [Bauhinia variegata]|uniref:Uncharacterized protein n=1 Tax=Bauhinia variegata TaxID=167791 RepID=A0ACB9MH33_BAUVA|nr:hypothetical protein L6164_022906 [Bauhinia variegata]
MLVLHGVSSFILDWLLWFLHLAVKRFNISENKVDRSWPLCLLLLAILGLLHLAEKNGAPSSNDNEDEQNELKAEEEKEAGGQEIQQNSLDYCEGGEFSGDRTATAGGDCAYCGNLSSTRCSRCRAARYCSVQCQIGHWRAGHRDECVEIEVAETQGSPVHGASKLVKKNKRKSYYPSNNRVEWNARVGEVEGGQRSDDCSAIVSSCNANGCAVCGGPTTTSCSRCKSVRYCSPKCLIEDWRWHKIHCSAGEVNPTKGDSPPHEKITQPQNLCEDDDIHSYGQLSLEYYPEGTAKTKSLVAISQEPAAKELHHTAECVRCYEDELAKSRNEIILLQSDRDKWAGRANFARERFLSLKKEYEQKLLVLKHEKELILNAEKQARNINQSLSERLYQLQIAVQASIAEKQIQEEHIQILEGEQAQTKKELQEERLYSQWLAVAHEKSHETAQVFMIQVEEIKVKLQEERENVQKLSENLLEDVKAAESRAAIAEERLHDLERKIKVTNDKVPIWTDSTGRPVMACAICLTQEKDLAFGCGHMTCRDCGSKISRCPICREQITSSVRLFPG